MADENNNQNPPDNSPPEETVSPEPPAKKGGLGIGTIALGSLAGVAGGASRKMAQAGSPHKDVSSAPVRPFKGYITTAEIPGARELAHDFLNVATRHPQLYTFHPVLNAQGKAELVSERERIAFEAFLKNNPGVPRNILDLQQTWTQYWNQFPEGMRSEKEQIQREQDPATQSSAQSPQMPQGVLSLASLPVITALTARDAFDPERRHQKQATAIVKKWQEANPKAVLSAPLFVGNPDGSLAVNHALFDQVPELLTHEKSRTFAYKDPEHDPLLKHITTTTAKETGDAVKTQGLVRGKDDQKIMQVKQDILAKKYDQFVKDSPHLAKAYQNHSPVNAALHRAAGTTPQPIAPSPAQKTPFFQKLTQPLRQPGIRYARQNKNRATPSTVRRPPNAKRPFLPSFPSLPGSLNLLNPLNPKKYLWLLLIIFGAVLAFLVFDEGGTVAEDTGDAGVSIVVTGPPKFTPDTSGEVDIGSSDESGSIGDGTTKNTTPQNTGDGTGIGDGSDATGSVQGIATGPDDINKPKAEVLQANVGSRAGLKPSKYDITVTVTGSADDVVVRLPLDPKGVYIAASQPCTYENGSVVWHLNQRPSATADGLCDHQQPVGDGTSVATSPEQTNTSQPASFPLAKFQGYGFPAPQSPSPQQMTGNTLSRWNTLKPLAQQAASATGVDIGIIGMWPWLEGSFVPFDNCDREHNLAGSVGDADHNTQCPYWGGAWQVGLGLHPAYTHMFVKEAFDTMYNGHDNATVQKVGNNVITNMRNRHGVTLSIISNPFPNVSLDTIITGAVNGDLQMRNLLTTLMKDDAIGIYMIARHFRDNVGVNSGLASKMEGWSSSYYNRQKIVNYIKGVYDAGVTGGSTDGSVSGGTSAVTSGTYTLSILILPKTGVDKEYIYEYATAEMINPRGTGSSGIGDNTQDTSGDVSTGTTAGLTCSMASPTQEPWPNVNKWNDKIIQAIALAKKTEGVEVPGNIVKAIMMMESGGDELPPNMSDYRGLMQVSEKTSKAEGSNCDWHNKPTYDVNTTQGNVNCGVQHLARGIKTCNGDTSAIIGQYFTGQCNYSSSGPDKFGTTPNAYVNKVIGTYNFLNSQVKDTCK